jgi:hypothetical protein
MTSINIHCAVEECSYNRSTHCTAPTIRIRSRSGVTNPHSSEDTNCETFKPR